MADDSITIVRVDLPGRPYDLEIAAGLLDRIGERLGQFGSFRTATVITDSNVASLYGQRLGESLLRAGIEYSLLAIPAGDQSKSLNITAELYDELAAIRHDRAQPIIALGGGVVGDLAGFVAATWHRGVPFVQCPTTLEAMIDAAIGGKTAINLPAGKNLVGVFHQPMFVCIDIDCLATLSERDFRAGLAESVKHAVIDNSGFCDWQTAHAKAILEHQPSALLELIRRNCAIKAAVVAADERELSPQGVGRAALNFGHTVGHALESASNYSLRHGEAVALGMIAEMELAVRSCGFLDAERQSIERLLNHFGVPCTTTFDPDAIVSKLISDKKNRGARIRFVLPRRLGDLVWIDSLPQSDILAALGRIQAR